MRVVEIEIWEQSEKKGAQGGLGHVDSPLPRGQSI